MTVRSCMQQTIDGVDPSLDPANQCGVFLGFANLGSTFGSIILTEKALVVVRYNVAHDRELLPFLQKEPDNPRLSFLRILLDTHPSGPVITSTDICKQQGVDEFADRQGESIQHQNLDYLSDDYEATTISDDDDTQVDELLNHAMAHISVPPFNPLSETAATSTPHTQIPVLADLADDISKEREKEERLAHSEEERLAHSRKASLRFRKLPTFATLGDSSITTKRNNRKRSNF